MSSNQEQIEYWNERAGETWAELQDRLDALLAPLSAAGLAAANVRPSERVLDVGSISRPVSAWDMAGSR